MPVWLGHPPHFFDSDEHGRQHHFPRAYVRDAEKNHRVMSALYTNSPMKLADMPLLFGTPRSEMWREQFIQLWHTGLPIGVVRMGARQYALHHLDFGPVPPEDVQQQYIIDKRMVHPYTLLFLEAIDHHGGASQKELSNLVFHAEKKANLDQVHPVYGDLENWGLVSGGQLTRQGRDVLESYESGLVFVCGVTDFGKKPFPVRLMWSILREIQGDDWTPYPFPLPPPPYRVSIDSILDRFSGPGKGKTPNARPEHIESMLKDLSIDHEISQGTLTIEENMFLAITPDVYVRAGLSEMDSINDRLLDTAAAASEGEKTEEDLSNRTWVIGDARVDLADYPTGSVNLNLKGWMEKCRELDKLTPSGIIFSPAWSPGWIEFASGELHAYVAAGGTVIIHEHQTTRIGTAKMYLTGLPQDVDRLNHIPVRGWKFDTGLGRNLGYGPPQPIYADSFDPPRPNDNVMGRFDLRYGDGEFSFISIYPYPGLYNAHDLQPPPVFTDTPHWKHRRIANLHRDPHVYKEMDTYPILGAEVLRDHIGFRLSETFSHHYEIGVAHQNWCDLAIMWPSPILFEVDALQGKSGQFGALSGDSTAIDAMHVSRQTGWDRSARRWCRLLREILEQTPYTIGGAYVAEVKRAISDRSRFKYQEPYMLELFNHVRNSADQRNRSQGYVDALDEALAPLGGRPSSVVIGTNYGWSEGKKQSAREFAMELEISLWTYGDLYEFLVRTDDWSQEERQAAFIEVVSHRDGPVCEYVGQL